MFRSFVVFEGESETYVEHLLVVLRYRQTRATAN